MNLRGGSTLYLDPKAIDIEVSLSDGRAVKLSVMPSDTVSSLRTKIQQVNVSVYLFIYTRAAYISI